MTDKDIVHELDRKAESNAGYGGSKIMLEYRAAREIERLRARLADILQMERATSDALVYGVGFLKIEYVDPRSVILKPANKKE